MCSFQGRSLSPRPFVTYRKARGFLEGNTSRCKMISLYLEMRACNDAARLLLRSQQARKVVPDLLKMSVFSCLCGRESESDDHFILCNCDACQVCRLDAEIRHVNGSGRGSCYRVSNHLPLHIKHLFVGCAVHRQVAGDLKMNGLPIAVAHR